MAYKGHEYKIIYCDPSKDWRAYKGMFHIDVAMGDSGYYKTHEEAESMAKSIIDKFVANVPQTKEQWLSAIEDCMVWTGYEDCHIDHAMAWDLLQKASKHLTTK